MIPFFEEATEITAQQQECLSKQDQRKQQKAELITVQVGDEWIYKWKVGNDLRDSI